MYMWMKHTTQPQNAQKENDDSTYTMKQKMIGEVNKNQKQ